MAYALRLALAERIKIHIVDGNINAKASEFSVLAGKKFEKLPAAMFIFAMHFDAWPTLRKQHELTQRRQLTIVLEFLATVVRFRAVR